MGNHLPTTGEVARRLDRLERRFEAHEIRIENHLESIRSSMREHGDEISKIVAAVELTAKKSPATIMQWIYIIVGVIGGGAVFIIALWMALAARGGL